MSSRVLRKLQGDKELNEDISDTEADLPVSGGARRKQLNINRYDLLNQQSHSESEVKEDDNETEANKSCEGEANHESVKRKKKKKKKKSGKHVNTQRSSEDNADVDEVERSVREVNKLMGDVQKVHTTSSSSSNKPDRTPRRCILTVQHKHLNPNNELKRIFGSKIIQSEQKRKNRGRGHVRNTWLVAGKDNWPQVGKTGLSMSLVETKYGGIQYFAFEHSQAYRQIQNKFLEAVETLNPDNIVAIINEHPYHIDALIQLSDLCKISEDLAMAAEFIERALYCLECAFHPVFNIAQGTCRLDYKRQENRALFITIFKHLLFVGGRACYRTALEFCKLLLSLDPDGDPLAVVLIIDFFALRSKEYTWLIEFANELEPSKNLFQLPNFAYSIALAHFHTANGDLTKADELLQHACCMFPGVLLPLLEQCSIQIDYRVSRHDYFFAAYDYQSKALKQLVQLYIKRSYHVWKEPDILPWLERNVHVLLDRIDVGYEKIVDCQEKRDKRYQGNLPRSISRHLLLSEVKDTSALPEDYSGGVFGFDPLPPVDSINIYSRKKTRPVQVNSSTVGVFFRSLFPNYSLDMPNLLEGEEGLGAVGGGDADQNVPNDLQTSVNNLVGAMRDLLSNIRSPDVPNDADVDENDDSDEDDEQNNYLT